MDEKAIHFTNTSSRTVSCSTNSKDNMNGIIAEKYVLGKQIGSGSFGQVYTAINTETSEQVAVKLEEVTAKKFRLQYGKRCIALFSKYHP